MAGRWLRGPKPPVFGADYQQASRGAMVFLYYYFRYLLGYTLIEESLTGATAFTDCTDANNTNGILVNSSFLFAVASGTPFTVGTDEGKFIVIVDSTNPENCGIHEIKTVTTGGASVTLDWYSTDYPTAATGLTWYMIDPTNVTSIVENDYFVFEVTNATTTWQMHCKLKHQGSGWAGLEFSFAPEASSWDTGTHAWKTTAPVIAGGNVVQPSCGANSDATAPRVYAYADTDGESLFMMFHRLDGTSNQTYASAYVLDPVFETTPTHSARDKLVVSGTGGYSVTGSRNGDASSGIGYGNCWINDPYYRARLTRWCGWYNASEYFKRSFTSPNHREGTEFDGLPIWIAADADVSEDPQWSILGALPSDHIFLGACKGIGEYTLFGSKLFMHWKEGICTPWPGLQHT